MYVSVKNVREERRARKWKGSYRRRKKKESIIIFMMMKLGLFVCFRFFFCLLSLGQMKFIFV